MKNHMIGIVAAFSLQVAQISANPVARGSDWPVCVWPGWDTHESFWSSTDGTYPACSAACFAHPECKSFAFAKGDCNLYDVNVQSNINWNTQSPYYFYDRNCEVVNQKCNVKGYQAKFSSYFWSNTLSYDQCTNACVSDNNCKSWAYGAGECYLYDVPTVGNIDGPGDYRWSDIGCLKPSSTTPTSASTTTPTIAATTPSSTTPSSTTPSSTTPLSTTSATNKASTPTTTTQKSTTMTTKTTSMKVVTTTTPKPTTTTKTATTTAKKVAASTTTPST